MKTCGSCLQSKPLSGFYKRSDSPDGFRNDCMECRKARSTGNYYAAHEDNIEQRRSAYRIRMAGNPNWHAENYAANREKMLVQSKEYYANNRVALVKNAVAWAKSNKGRANANKAAYKAAKSRACPTWVRGDPDLLWVMQEAYSLAALRSAALGFQWHVDHVVPLRASAASGLHVPWNLQVIPGSENCSKSNKFAV